MQIIFRRLPFAKFSLLGVAFLLASTPATARPAACNGFEGAAVIADDGTYLGKITNQYDSKSIFNRYGTYGSPYSAKSIWNKYGAYGSEYSVKSAMSKYTTKSPSIVTDGEVIGYLTKNKYRRGAVDPVVLGISCYDYEPDN